MKDCLNRATSIASADDTSVEEYLRESVLSVEEGRFPRLSIMRGLHEGFKANASKRFCISDEDAFTYAQAYAKVNALAGYFQETLGLGPDSTIVLSAPNLLITPIVLGAAQLVGARVVVLVDEVPEPHRRTVGGERLGERGTGVRDRAAQPPVGGARRRHVQRAVGRGQRREEGRVEVGATRHRDAQRRGGDRHVVVREQDQRGLRREKRLQHRALGAQRHPFR